jgi:hypothetical protein
MDESGITAENIANRQAESIQFRVQQHLSLYDDEIERLSTVLNRVKTRILESRQQIREIDAQIIETREYKSGAAKRKQVGISTSLAKVKARQHQELQQLQTVQTAEIEMEQAEFEAGMERLTDSANAKLAESTEELDNEISKLRGQLATYRASADKIQQHEEAVLSDMEEHVETVNSGVIDELHQIVQQRNAERYQNLHQSREKLTLCIDTLDHMTRSHSLAVNERRVAIKEIEKKYESDLAAAEEHHRAKITRLRSTLVEVSARTKTLLRAAHHLERTNQKQLNETMRDLELMRSRTLARTDNPLLRAEDTAGVEAARKALNGLARQRAVKEEGLSQARGANDGLKREIWRVRHDLRFVGGRRA